MACREGIELPTPEPLLGLDDLKPHPAELACMRRAEDGLANHRMAWLVGTRGLDLHTEYTGSRPVMFQIARELACRQRCLRLGPGF